MTAAVAEGLGAGEVVSNTAFPCLSAVCSVPFLDLPLTFQCLQVVSNLLVAATCAAYAELTEDLARPKPVGVVTAFLRPSTVFP